MVEAPEVEHAMVELAKTIDPHFASLTPGQVAAYNASHAFRDSFVAEWGVRDATKRKFLSLRGRTWLHNWLHSSEPTMPNDANGRRLTVRYPAENIVPSVG